MNNLQALKALKQSAEKQNEELESSIKETHEQSLEQLSKDLRIIMRKKLNKIEKDIKMSEKTTLQSIEAKIKTLSQSRAKRNVFTALLSLIIGGVIGAYTLLNFYPWIVPKSMRYNDTDGSKYIMINQAIKKNQTTYIKIRG